MKTNSAYRKLSDKRAPHAVRRAKRAIERIALPSSKKTRHEFIKALRCLAQEVRLDVFIFATKARSGFEVSELFEELDFRSDHIGAAVRKLCDCGILVTDHSDEKVRLKVSLWFSEELASLKS
jgi:hypothetical protein